jgi:hypothetical protein
MGSNEAIPGQEFSEQSVDSAYNEELYRPHLGNDIMIHWSKAGNQRWPIVKYLVRRVTPPVCPPGPSSPHWETTDTVLYICPNDVNTAYKVYVYGISSAGDTSLPISASVYTGGVYSCEGDINITRDTDNNGSGIPQDLVLYQNNPNPFNMTTEISFSIPDEANVCVTIYDILGREVCILANRRFEPGRHKVTWNGQNHRGTTVSSGVYFYRIDADGYSETRKMLLMK